MAGSTALQVALVWTEFQENVLLSALQGAGIDRLELLFLRDRVADASRLRHYARKVVLLRDLYPSWRNLRQIRSEVAAKLDPVLPQQNFEIWLCNYTHPYGRRLVFDRRCSGIHLLDEGCGCYVDPGFMGSIYGGREILFLLLSRLCYPDYGGTLWWLPLNRPKESWSFFPGCFPTLKLPSRLIDHRCLETVLFRSVPADAEPLRVAAGAALYLPQPFSDTNFVSEEVDRRINHECISSFLKANPEVVRILWKPHPRAIIAHEKARVAALSRAFGIGIDLIEERVNFEKFLFLLQYQGTLPVFSTMSSSLYVAKTLEHRGLQVFSVVSRTVLEIEPVSPQIYAFFGRIGITVLGGDAPESSNRR